MAADRTAALRTPTLLQDKLYIPSDWKGTDLFFDAKAGSENQYYWKPANFIDAQVVDRECQEQGIPLEIYAIYPPSQQRLLAFKVGLTPSERMTAETNLEATKRDAQEASAHAAAMKGALYGSEAAEKAAAEAAAKLAAEQKSFAAAMIARAGVGAALTPAVARRQALVSQTKKPLPQTLAQLEDAARGLPFEEALAAYRDFKKRTVAAASK